MIADAAEPVSSDEASPQWQFPAVKLDTLLIEMYK